MILNTIHFPITVHNPNLTHLRKNKTDYRAKWLYFIPLLWSKMFGTLRLFWSNCSPLLIFIRSLHALHFSVCAWGILLYLGWLRNTVFLSNYSYKWPKIIWQLSGTLACQTSNPPHLSWLPPTSLGFISQKGDSSSGHGDSGAPLPIPGSAACRRKRWQVAVTPWGAREKERETPKRNKSKTQRGDQGRSSSQRCSLQIAAHSGDVLRPVTLSQRALR